MTLATLRKAIGALLGAVTGAGLVTAAAHLGLTLDPTVASAVAGLLALVGTYLAPKNEEPPVFTDAADFFVDADADEHLDWPTADPEHVEP